MRKESTRNKLKKRGASKWEAAAGGKGGKENKCVFEHSPTTLLVGSFGRRLLCCNAINNSQNVPQSDRVVLTRQHDDLHESTRRVPRTHLLTSTTRVFFVLSHLINRYRHPLLPHPVATRLQCCTVAHRGSVLFLLAPPCTSHSSCVSTLFSFHSFIHRFIHSDTKVWIELAQLLSNAHLCCTSARPQNRSTQRSSVTQCCLIDG